MIHHILLQFNHFLKIYELNNDEALISQFGTKKSPTRAAVSGGAEPWQVTHTSKA